MWSDHTRSARPARLSNRRKQRHVCAPGHSGQAWENERVTSKPSTPPVPARAYETVLNSIEADLRAGRIKLGDQLPGERALAETHGISRASVRDAIRILDAMGVVRTSTGSGPNSGAVVISEPAIGLSAALRLHVASRQLSVADIVESRILLETWAAESADLTTDPRRSAAVLQRAGALLGEMDAPGLDREEFHALGRAVPRAALIVGRQRGDRGDDGIPSPVHRRLRQRIRAGGQGLGQDRNGPARPAPRDP